MKDWAIDYISHVLEAKDWSANRLATEAGVAASTISRPLRIKNYNGHLSRQTITKIFEASGIDPAPFIPKELAEDSREFTGNPAHDRGQRLWANLHGRNETRPERNDIRFVVVGDKVQIAATLDRAGLAKLRRKLDDIERLLDE